MRALHQPFAPVAPFGLYRPGPSAFPPTRCGSGPFSAVMEPAFPYGEDLLQYIWESRLHGAAPLFTTDGRAVEVLRPGRIQHNSGPDLDDALVRIDGGLWAGTVEVHLRSSDWNAHGHQVDPAYANVVLHVVYEHDAEVRTLHGTTLPTVELQHRVPLEGIALHRTLMQAQGFVPCADRIHEVDPLRVGPWLDRVLVERLERRAEAVLDLYRRTGQDAASTLYHLVAGAFGMQVNAAPFGMLAQALPWKLLVKYRDDAVRTEALLFGQAGFLRSDLVDDHARRLQQEHAHLARLHGLVPMPVAAWKFTRMRPFNFPTLRIAQFAALIGHLGADLHRLLESEDLFQLRTLLGVQAGAYWNDRSRFDVPGPASVKRLGPAAVDQVIINALVPALFTFGRVLARPAWQERALALLEQLPAERNTVLDGWAALGVHAASAGRGQALLELRSKYCSLRRCLSCTVGNQLMRSSVQ